MTPGAANIVTGQKRNLFALAKTWYHQFSLTALKLMQSNKTIGGFHLGFLYDEHLIRSTLFKLVELYRQGNIKPHIDSCYHFEEVSSFHSADCGKWNIKYFWTADWSAAMLLRCPTPWDECMNAKTLERSSLFLKLRRQKKSQLALMLLLLRLQLCLQLMTQRKKRLQLMIKQTKIKVFFIMLSSYLYHLISCIKLVLHSFSHRINIGWNPLGTNTNPFPGQCCLQISLVFHSSQLYNSKVWWVTFPVSAASVVDFCLNQR